MPVGKDYRRAMLTPESRCEDYPFDGIRCWTFREERGYFLRDAVYSKVWHLLGLAQ